MDRRLAAILSADVVGYSRLMAADEEGTLAQLKAHRKELIEPKTAEHQGRVVKLMGDGTLMEFASVVDALNFAIDVQRAMAERNAAVPDDQRVAYRVGINIGDIIVDGDDIYGDGVNVAARLQELADPGGIFVSRTVFDHVKGKVDLVFEDLGEQAVKNIPEPIRVYRVPIRTVSADTVVTGAKDASPATWKRPALVAATATLIVVAGIALWMRPWEPAIETASVERMAFPLPDKPSIAVLPFTNMSGDPEQEYFADGITEDLITDLSKISGLFVIARNSTFSYKGQQVKVRRVAEDLGVRYVLEGSVRRAGDQVRINAQLIDAMTGGHLWAERYDGNMSDVFALQDKVTESIVAALALNLTDSEQEEIARDETRNVDAREAFQIGWEHHLRFNPDDNAKAIPYFEKAVELDPGYGRAYAALALVYMRGVDMNQYRQIDNGFGEAFAKVRLNLRDAAIYPTSLGSVAASQFHLWFGRNEDGVAAAARALALDPNDPEAHLAMAWALIATGRVEDGVVSIRTAMRLNPRYASHYSHALGVAQFGLGQLDEAARVLEQALERNPLALELAPALAATYVRLGRRNEARAVLRKWEANATDPALAPTLVKNSLPYLFRSPPKRMWELLVDGVRLALLPPDLTIEVLADTLKNGDIGERRDAARNIGLFGPMARDAVAVLIAAMKDENRFVRREAVSALGKIGRPAKAAVEALEAASQDPTMRSRAEEALKRIAGE